MFFDSWYGLFRVAIAGAVAYVALVLLIRISGKRTLSKFNAFDFVVTVALGSMLATVVLSKDVPLLEGILGFGLLILGQYTITTLSVKSEAVRRIVKSNPRLLVYRGRLLHDALRRERVTVEEIYAVVRAHGRQNLEDVGAIVLETDATIHLLDLDDDEKPAALEHVTGFEDVRS